MRTAVVGGGEIVARGAVAAADGQDGVLRDFLHAEGFLEAGHLGGRLGFGVGADGHASRGTDGASGARAGEAREQGTERERACDAATEHAVCAV